MSSQKITYRIVGELSPEAQEEILRKLIVAGLERMNLDVFTNSTKEAA